jgi:hypothetical protein
VARALGGRGVSHASTAALDSPQHKDYDITEYTAPETENVTLRIEM